MKEFYNLHLTQSALQELISMASEQQRKVLNDIEYLTINPYSDRCRRVRETPLYRLRIEDWRVLFSVDDKNLSITIYAIRRKRDLRLELSI